MKKILIAVFTIVSITTNAQNVGIGTPNPLNKLHVAGGFRLDTLIGVNGAGLLKHDAGGVVYGLKFTGNINEVLRGDGTFGTVSTGPVNGATGWLLDGNSGTNPLLNFMGTTDDQPLIFKIRNTRSGIIDSLSGNTSLGFKSLSSNTTGRINMPGTILF